MKNAQRVFCAVVAVAFLLPGYLVFAGGKKDTAPTSAPAAETPKTSVPIKGTIRLSTTTSTQDSGLLDYILPVFTAETGWKVDVISVGTGAALKMGEDGEADVLLVHAKAQEETFVAAGHGLKRFDVMYNDFIVVGPSAPLAHNGDVNGTFKAIADRNLPFVSRGDKSGTHTMELNLWKAAGVDPAKLGKYTSAGQGMGATLQMASELLAYTLADRATWLKQKGSALTIVCEKGSELLNFYGVIAVNPAKNSQINAQGAQDFINWIRSPATQTLIGGYGVAEFGGSLFTPNVQVNQ
ncbi:tungsten ABC transporter substrate-binding protein [Spirochaetia bacterium]|nr:tungsten ABC transporter substrate-binding protein [Spirochaetia bacterium]